jgi:hypothetical protein
MERGDFALRGMLLADLENKIASLRCAHTKFWKRELSDSGETPGGPSFKLGAHL